METTENCLAVIGGSGLYEFDGFEVEDEVKPNTPYGKINDPIVCGRLGETRFVFLSRHGRGHRRIPSAVNYRANICALKMLGATHVLSVSAVGSMREEIPPGMLVCVDQIIDWTRRRRSTFFHDGVAVHVQFADPVCPTLRDALASAVRRRFPEKLHDGGTYLCMEGPQFSTRAESMLYRSWDAVHVIGMTSMPEAKLAREAELPYAVLALATDYDCWHEAHEAVTAEAVMKVMAENVSSAKEVIIDLSSNLPDPTKSIAYKALDGAIMTDDAVISKDARARLSWLRPFFMK
ncbi:MAG: S-methyl-5'-thioadenosine phosphorylase [Candidatus Uhrbacteria bacterium]